MSTFKIANRNIGPDYPPFVIAEIGINHEGNIDKAIQMIEHAKKAGCECVKFQMHVIEDEMAPEAQKVIPGNANESIWQIMKRCALTKSEHIRLQKHCKDLGMIYLCTPFSRAAANILQEMNVAAYKIGSGECNNYPLLKHIASFGKPVILSTGMNDISTITTGVEIFSQIPLALMHCTSMYPTPYDKVRLAAITQMQEIFPHCVLGLSDHSIGNYTCFAAVALGADIVEKHFTSNINWAGPDVPISITPEQLQELIIGANAIFQARGGEKNILPEEKPTIDFAYASVVTTKDIAAGEIFTSDNLWVKRPGTGEILAKEYEQILGKTAKNDLAKDILLRRGDFD